MSSKNLVLTPLPECNTKKFDGIKISNKDFTEYCIYKRPFLVNSQSVVKTCTIDRTRSFTYDENGVLIPIKDSATISKLETSINDSRNRAKSNLFGYALNNEWESIISDLPAPVSPLSTLSPAPNSMVRLSISATLLIVILSSIRHPFYQFNQP